MSFNSNIPQATDLISVSQQDLLNNFTSMQSTYTTDHYGFNPLTNLGYHKQITLVDDALVVRSTAAGRLIEYAVTTNAQTYPALQRDGTTTVYQALPIKAYALFLTSNTGSAPVSSFTLPYANVSAITRTGVGTYTVTFVDNFPNTAYGILSSFNAFTSMIITATPLSTSQIQITVRSPAGTFNDISTFIMVACLN